MDTQIPSVPEGRRVVPLTPELWADLERLFGPRGACSGCWCMWWRLKRAEFGRIGGQERKEMLRAATASGEVPGLLAYLGGEPVGWCSVAPRERFARLERYRTLRRLDDEPAWSVVCLFVAQAHRRQGMTVELLRAAVGYARERGASIVEGYPVEVVGGRARDADLFTGTVSAFEEAGFVRVRSEPRTIMRYFGG